jgi:predicted unusual protein kinase regulating ubiquinone biosynthesis (AarF/ABC1/UbiB family)
LPGVLRTLRAYRTLRAGLVIVAAVLRYTWLRWRKRLPWVKPTPASWDRAHAKTGRAIYRLATGMGGAFVKLGQVLGARADVLPAALIEPLRGLHDKVPPRPFAKLRGHVERELGKPLSAVFAEVDEQPLAAASLAQVHAATLVGGDRVAIKIQYPEARKLFPVDFRSLRRAVRVVRWLNKKLDLRTLADELAEFVLLELDFAREAESTERVRAAFAGTPGVRIPRVYRELSTDRLLVLEFVAGTPATRIDELAARGLDLRRIAESIASIYCAMIFDHGFFQADPHPGNLLVAPDGTTVVVLDFGLAKELPAGFADGAAAMIVKALAGDLDGALAAARSIGFEADGDRAAFGDLVKLLMGRHAEVGRDAIDVIGASSLRKVPPHFTLIGRAFILLNGLSHRLVPGERVIPGAVATILAPRMMRAAAGAASSR